VAASFIPEPILKGDAFESYCLLTPSFTAPGVVAEPVLWGPAAVPAPEVLASPPGEGLLLAPVVPLFMEPVSFFIVPCGAPGPTLPWLDAPSLGWAFCAAAGKASARMQAEANTIFFTNDLPGSRNGHARGLLFV